jgi:peptidoglycan/xylan/chitin deacetylase (PgdA/CDA1 family)
MKKFSTENKKVIVTTSWDDGDVLDVRLAALLDKYGVKGTFYIAPNMPNRLSDDEIIAISNKHEIGAHTMDHPLLTKIPADEAEKQITQSKDYLEKIIGKQVKMFAYPAGDYNASIIDLVKSHGFDGARTTHDWSWSKPVNAFEIPTSLHVYPHPVRPSVGSIKAGFQPFFNNLPEIIRHKFPLKAIFSWQNLFFAMFDRACADGGVFHIWGHSWEIDKYNLWGDLENLLKYVNSHEGAEFKTNSEII